jgi:PAS domain S-box-containing protein
VARLSAAWTGRAGWGTGARQGIIGSEGIGTAPREKLGAQLYGFTAQEAIGCHITLIVPPDRRDELQQLLTQLRRGERLAPCETGRVRKDGTRIAVSLTVSPIMTPEGVVLGASAIARDITAQKQLQEQLRHAQKMEALGQLTRGLAHNFNTNTFQPWGDHFAQAFPQPFNLLVLDNSACHTTKALRWPSNMVPVFLPPYSPKLNLIEWL